MSDQVVDAFSQIKWAQVTYAKARKAQGRKELVKMLCELGTVSETRHFDYAINLPIKYVILGKEVLFLPHKDFIVIGDIKFEVPTSRDAFGKMINAVKNLDNCGRLKQRMTV